MLIIYQKKKIIESDWLWAMQVLLQTAQKQGFSGFSMVATINRFHYPVIFTGKCFHVYIIFWRVNHNFSPSIWNSLALVCFFKKLKLQFWYFLKNNLGQIKKFQIDLEVTWYLDIHYLIISSQNEKLLYLTYPFYKHSCHISDACADFINTSFTTA